MTNIKDTDLNKVSGGIGEENYLDGWWVASASSGLTLAGPFERREDAQRWMTEYIKENPDREGDLYITRPPY